MFDREYLPFWLACIALVFSFLLMIAFHAGSSSSDLAAWVQAIGSIGAILGAVLVMERQHRLQAALEARRLLERRKETLVVALDLLRELEREAGRLYDEVKDKGMFIKPSIGLAPSIDVEGFVLALCSIDATDLSDAALRVELVRVQRRSELFMTLCEDLRNPGRPSKLLLGKSVVGSLIGARKGFASSISAFEAALSAP